MTMDFTVLELVLLVWAVCTTAWWLDARRDARMSRFVLIKFIEDPKARAQVLELFDEEFKRDTA